MRPSVATSCRTLRVCVPVRWDPDASSSPFISRSSERGYVLFFVVTPPASRSGWRTVSGLPELSVGRVRYQLRRSSNWLGRVAEPATTPKHRRRHAVRTS